MSDDKFNVHDLYELRVMEQVEDSPRLNNRMVKEKLGVSVRLAHDILGRMVSKGLLHVTKHHARRWDYFLTPKGITEKARLTFDFLDFSMHFYHEARKLSSQLCKDLTILKKTNVSFIGAGDLAEIVYLGVQEWGMELTTVYDDEKAGKTFMKVDVKSIDEIAEDEADCIIICLYDRKQPKKEHYLPSGIPETDKMYWIFESAASDQ
ncbi:MAG: hypothetical protein MJH11_03660 [Lentisphaeria bacterium]|nr:hypothetical protein [Lentisphaeria bacterium]